MRYCLLLSLLLASLRPAFAQSAAPGSRYQYATLYAVGIYGRSPQLEYGQHAKHGIPDAELEKQNQRLDELDSAPLALNYLTGLGWEYLGMSASESNSSYRTLYLLRRRLP